MFKEYGVRGRIVCFVACHDLDIESLSSVSALPCAFSWLANRTLHTHRQHRAQPTHVQYGDSLITRYEQLQHTLSLDRNHVLPVRDARKRLYSGERPPYSRSKELRLTPSLFTTTGPSLSNLNVCDPFTVICSTSPSGGGGGSARGAVYSGS